MRYKANDENTQRINIRKRTLVSDNDEDKNGVCPFDGESTSSKVTATELTELREFKLKFEVIGSMLVELEFVGLGFLPEFKSANERNGCCPEWISNGMVNIKIPALRTNAF